MRIDGQCHCGAIRREADIDPADVRICHCTDCQTQSGTAFRTNATATRGNFRLLAGAPKIYVKIAESGNPRALAFCGECGTPIYGANAGDDPPAYNIRLGTARQHAELVPRYQLWSRSACGWLSRLGEVPKFEKQKI